MANEVAVSVIIPIYNMGQYIENAITSIENQTLQKKEIIIIDDGSTDLSSSIIERCAQNYSNIKILRQNNKGAGEARNLGIQKARGEYVCFLDADDFYVSNDVLEYLYKLAKEKDCYICGGTSYDYVDGKIRKNGMRKERRFFKDEYIQKEKYPGIAGYCAFIFQKKFLIENQIFFPIYRRGQDTPFFVKAIACAGKAYCSKKPIYVYRKQHKKVVFDEEKALGIAGSYRDVFKIAIDNDMREVEKSVREELRGELGALIYRYIYLGSEDMYKIVKDFNRFANNKYEKNIFPEKKEIEKYVKDNEILKNEFIQKLRNLDQVYVFGAGVVGRKVVVFLKENHINVDGILVSDISQNSLMIEDIPVKQVDQIEFNDLNYVVIIATFWFLHDEIISALHEKRITNLYIIDLCRFFLWQCHIEH